MKKLLLLISSEENLESLIESSLYLRKNYNYKIVPLYIRNIGIFIPPTHLMITALGGGIVDKKLEEVDNERIRRIQNILYSRGVVEHVAIEIGFPHDIVTEYAKQVDIILTGREKKISEEITSILKDIYKPIFLIGEKSLSFERVVIASDDGVKINRSVTNFLNHFPHIMNFEMISYRFQDDRNMLLELLESKHKIIEYRNIENMEIVYNEINKGTLLIMGNLSKSYFLKKITKRKGLDIIENSNVSIFIA